MVKEHYKSDSLKDYENNHDTDWYDSMNRYENYPDESEYYDSMDSYESHSCFNDDY